MKFVLSLSYGCVPSVPSAHPADPDSSPPSHSFVRLFKQVKVLPRGFVRALSDLGSLPQALWTAGFFSAQVSTPLLKSCSVFPAYSDSPNPQPPAFLPVPLHEAWLSSPVLVK